MAKEFFCTSSEPIVRTVYGPVHGMKFDGVYSFKGIRYAKARRFRMPEAPDPWEDPEPCFTFKYECPMMAPQGFESALFIPRIRTIENEQCHYLNVWTSTLDSNAGKTVMVWLHGGAFASGSGHSHASTDGASLAQRGDVVVVTLNHRLNWLGFLDVSSLGEQYENSVNAGMADIVFALRWVRDNIASFGGNPDDVTVFGQSGGGEKVQALLQIPQAQGLFRRGIIQSGVYDQHQSTPEERKEFLRRLLKKMDLSPNQPELLEKAPYADVTRALASLIENPYALWMYFCPQKNGWYRGNIREEGLSASGKKADILLGSVYSEFNSPQPFDTAGRKAGWPEIRAKLTEKCGGDTARADRVIALFQTAYPEKPPCALLWLDTMFRKPTLELADRLALESEGAVYSYFMDFTLSVGEGVTTRHCMDIPFVFHNKALVPVCNFGEASDRLEEEISGAWISFAKKGDPWHSLLPAWPRYTAKEHAVMVFGDEKSECRVDPDASLAREMFALMHR